LSLGLESTPAWTGPVLNQTSCRRSDCCCSAPELLTSVIYKANFRKNNRLSRRLSFPFQGYSLPFRPSSAPQAPPNPPPNPSATLYYPPPKAATYMARNPRRPVYYLAAFFPKKTAVSIYAAPIPPRAARIFFIIFFDPISSLTERPYTKSALTKPSLRSATSKAWTIHPHRHRTPSSHILDDPVILVLEILQDSQSFLTWLDAPTSTCPPFEYHNTITC